MATLRIYPHHSDFTERFRQARAKILEILGKNVDIYHIGSTTIQGVGGKGIIDILIGVRDWTEGDVLVQRLRKSGFPHWHPRKRGRAFLSNIKNTGFGDVHIHVVRKNTKQYKLSLGFRDYLRRHRGERERYSNFKGRWLEEAKGNRDIYQKLKNSFIQDVLKGINE